MTAIRRTEEQVIAKVEFAARPDDHPMNEEWMPATIFSLFKQGVLNAFSVGFVPTDARAATSRDCTKYGDECRQVINRWKMLELSVVGIGCNQDAVALAVSKGIVTQATADKLFAPPVKEEAPPEPSESAEEDGGEDETPEPDMRRVKEVVHTIATAPPEPAVKHVTATVTPPETKQRQMKVVNRFIPAKEVEVARKVCKTVVRTVAKARGRIWLDE